MKFKHWKFDLSALKQEMKALHLQGNGKFKLFTEHLWVSIKTFFNVGAFWCNDKMQGSKDPIPSSLSQLNLQNKLTRAREYEHPL